MPRPTGRFVSAEDRARRLDTRIVAGHALGFGLAGLVVVPLDALVSFGSAHFTGATTLFHIVTGASHGVVAGLVTGIAVRTIAPLRARVLAGPLPLAAFGAAIGLAAAPLFPLGRALQAALDALAGRDGGLAGTPPPHAYVAGIVLGALAGLVAWRLLRPWLREAAADAARPFPRTREEHT
jgi:hypothetical protein